MPEELKYFMVGIHHLHDGEYGTTVGKIMARDAEDALARADAWLKRKRQECRCDEYDDGRAECTVSVRDTSKLGLKTMMLMICAERIEDSK